MSCNFLPLLPPVLKNRPNRAQSIDSLSLANSTPDQSPKTSRLTLSSKAKKITPSSSANVTPDQSPKTSVHRLTAHCKNTMTNHLDIVCFHMTTWRPYLCPKTMKRRPCLCPKPVLWELNSLLM